MIRALKTDGKGERNNSMKIGIIDVGGGMRGIYGAGVFDYCMANDIHFDVVEGVSAGSANGIAYLAGQKNRNYEFYNNYSFRKEYMSAENLLRKGSYLDFDYIYGTLTNEDGEYPLDYDALMENPAHMEIVATDAYTGKPVYLQKENIERNNYVFLKMSCCVPVIDRPYPFNGSKYYDGGMSDPIPFQRAFDHGCDKVVIILTRPKDYRRIPDKDKRMARLILRKYKGARTALINRASLYNRQLEQAIALEKTGKVKIIAPDDISGLKTLTLNHQILDHLYKKGLKDAEAIPQFLSNPE